MVLLQNGQVDNRQLVTHLCNCVQVTLFKTDIVNGEVHFTSPERLAGPVKAICGLVT